MTLLDVKFGSFLSTQLTHTNTTSPCFCWQHLDSTGRGNGTNHRFSCLRIDTRRSRIVKCFYFLTWWITFLLEKVTVSFLTKKFPICYGARKLIAVLTTTCLGMLFRGLWIHFTSLYDFCINCPPASRNAPQVGSSVSVL